MFSANEITKYSHLIETSEIDVYGQVSNLQEGGIIQMEMMT